MTIGRLYGLLAILLGGILSVLGYDMLTETGSVFKFLIVGPVMFLFGIALAIFPGYPVSLKQSRNKEIAPDAFYKNAPKAHKKIWLIAAVLGFCMALFFIM
jgi:hypothetical protein